MEKFTERFVVTIGRCKVSFRDGSSMSMMPFDPGGLTMLTKETLSIANSILKRMGLDQRLRYLQIVFVSTPVKAIAFVFNKDSLKGYNRIFINVWGIYRSNDENIRLNFIQSLKKEGLDRSQIRERLNAERENLRRKVQSLFMAEYRKLVPGTIAHEITHLWQTKASNATEISKRNRQMLASVIGKDAKDLSSEKNLLYDIINFRMLDIHKFGKFMLELYISIRNRLGFVFKDMICSEGVAEFMGEFVTGASHEMIKAKAAQRAHMLRDRYSFFLGDLEDLVQSLAELVRKHAGKFDFIASKIGDKYLYEVENELKPYPELMRLLRKIRHAADDVKEFLDEVKMFAYSIGPAVPATLHEHGWTIEQIGNLTPPRLIREYEDLCIRKGIRPIIIADRPSTIAFFNFGAALKELNLLRKRVQKLL